MTFITASWNDIPANKPADLILGKVGAFRWFFDGDTIEVECRSVNSGKITTIKLPGVYVDDFLDWLDGTLIQVALPNLSAEQRELLINGEE